MDAWTFEPRNVNLIPFNIRIIIRQISTHLQTESKHCYIHTRDFLISHRHRNPAYKCRSLAPKHKTKIKNETCSILMHIQSSMHLILFLTSACDHKQTGGKPIHFVRHQRHGISPVLASLLGSNFQNRNARVRGVTCASDAFSKYRLKQMKKM